MSAPPSPVAAQPAVRWPSLTDSSIISVEVAVVPSNLGAGARAIGGDCAGGRADDAAGAFGGGRARRFEQLGEPFVDESLQRFVARRCEIVTELELRSSGRAPSRPEMKGLAVT